MRASNITSPQEKKRAIGKQRELQARTKNGAELPIQLGIIEVRTKGGSKLNHSNGQQCRSGTVTWQKH
jgi:hypothetical protein